MASLSIAGLPHDPSGLVGVEREPVRQLNRGIGGCRWARSRRRLVGLRRALRTTIADRIEDVADLGHSLVNGEAVRRILARKFDCALPSVRVGPIPGPAMLLAFADGAGFLQKIDRPSPRRPDRRPSFPGHQHCEITPAGTNPGLRKIVPRVSTGQGFANGGAGLVHKGDDECSIANWSARDARHPIVGLR